MDFDEYQQKAMKSVAITEKGIAALAHRSLGLTGEAGEAANIVKKIIRDKNGEITRDDAAVLKEKLGDTLYYLAVLSEYLDFNLSEVAEANLQKSATFLENRSKTSDN
jgi:NTP pyrophosphatase (non-canonical NTP hydrolase)